MLPEWVYQECPRISAAHRDAAFVRQCELTKPAGALGRLEVVAIELAGMQHTDRPRAARAPIIVFAGDHGIAAQGVSAYPQDVTIAMMANFAAGGAAISVLARELGSSLEVVDAGTLAAAPMPGVITDKPRRGSGDFSRGAALDAADVAFAFDCGQRAVARAARGRSVCCKPASSMASTSNRPSAPAGLVSSHCRTKAASRCATEMWGHS